jgi:hypothetical protein
MKILEIRDNGGETYDRYTVVYDSVEYTDGHGTHYEARGMSDNPFSPLGFGQMCTAMTGKHLGKKIKFSDLPENCQKLVRQDLGE